MSTYSISLNDIEKIDFIITEGMTAKQVYDKYKPNYILNGALYDFSTKGNITNAKDEGVKSGYLFSQEGIGFKEDNSIEWSTMDSATRDFIAGSPCLVKNGKKYIDWGNKYSSYVDGSHKRSCIGFNDTHLFLFASDNENTIDETAENCIKLGMKYAINLDGGGSCHLQKDTTIVKASSRANCSWILVYLKKQPIVDTTTSKVEANKVTVKCGDVEQDGYIENGVTYAPVRFLAESLGANVLWDGVNKVVTIVKK